MSARPDGRKGIVGLLRSVLFGLGVAVAWCGLGGETAQSQSGKAEIYISDSAKVDGIKRDKFNLRPNVEIPYFVFVKNTADADKTFEVKLLNADDSSEITKSAPTPVAAGTTVPVKLLPPMPPPDPKSLPECPAAGFKLNLSRGGWKPTAAPGEGPAKRLAKGVESPYEQPHRQDPQVTRAQPEGVAPCGLGDRRPAGCG